MEDAIYILTAVVFFALSMALVSFCTRLGGDVKEGGDR
jgi:hypothetical protein